MTHDWLTLGYSEMRNCTPHHAGRDRDPGTDRPDCADAVSAFVGRTCCCRRGFLGAAAFVLLAIMTNQPPERYARNAQDPRRRRALRHAECPAELVPS